MAMHDLFKLLREKSTNERTKRNSLYAGDRRVIIYGAGNVGKDVFRVLTEEGFSVICFLDKYAGHGERWRDVPVLQPDDNSVSQKDRKTLPVVIGIFNAIVEIPPIVYKLKSLGYDNVITFLEFYEWFSEQLGDRFWLTTRSYYEGLEPIIAAGYELWEDEMSREIYASTLKFRFTGDYSVLPKPDKEHQYFPLDIPQWQMPLRLIDCGAYSGDTIGQLLEAGIEFEAIAAFEPDQRNFIELAKFVEKNENILPDPICLYPCGVHSCTDVLRFSSGQKTLGAISRLLVTR